jgi:hypothetical protein
MFKEEYHIQTALIHWLRMQHPGVLFTIAPVGAIRIPAHVGAAYKRMGYSRGTPDILIFEPSKEYHGLFVELKAPKGRLSPEQKEWLACLEDRGYQTAVCRSCEEAIIVIEKYLK